MTPKEYEVAFMAAEKFEGFDDKSFENMKAEQFAPRMNAMLQAMSKRKQIIEELKSMSARRTVTSSCHQLGKNEQSVSSENLSQSCFANHIKNYLVNHSRKVLFVFRKFPEEKRNEILDSQQEKNARGKISLLL